MSKRPYEDKKVPDYPSVIGMRTPRSAATSAARS
jgi:hypothetical protein